MDEDDSNRMSSESSSNFTVKFGKYARTLEYDEPQVHILFTFDVVSKDDKSVWTVCLEHHAPETPRGARYDIAFERTKQYLESRGYKVEICGR